MFWEQLSVHVLYSLLALVSVTKALDTGTLMGRVSNVLWPQATG